MDGFLLFRADMRRDFRRWTRLNPIEVAYKGLFRRHLVRDGAAAIFRSLARRTTGSGKPPTPTTVTTSAAPTTVPAPAVPTTAPPSVTPTTVTPSVTPTTAQASAKPTTVPASARPTTAPASAKPTTVSASARPTTASPSEPRDTSARKTTTAAKGSRLPSSTRTEIVAALPALSAPLPSDHDAKKAAKGKGHAGDDRKRSSDRDDVIDVDREPKRAQARSASPPHRVSGSVFESKASTRSLFSTLVFHDDDVASINTKSSGDMMRQGLNFLTLVNNVGHELEAEVEDLNKELEDAKRRTETARSVAEPPKLEDELTFLTADVAEHTGDEERFERLMKNFHGLLHVLDPRVKAPIAAAQDRKLETYAASVGVADPSGSLLGGTSSCKATVVGVDGKFSLIGGVGAEVTKSRIDDVAKGAGTVGAPEEMRTDEDFQGPRIDALTEDPRLDDVFGETEAEGAPITQVAPPGVDEETIP
ncbi:hypothetical protein AALP_AAs48387U000300 [Arabis alpina]|uniref:Uncharacterized protein n=1 Tax=Arabis alpina TaxID=50452 RepID=A0A087G2B4_ARAAL|nr:hypothetical protein AALP_AAs48387U000300 [Arabis alpina]